MEFLLFLLVNAVLFIRPSELIPELAALPIYNIVIVINLIVAGPAIINHLRSDNLLRSPMTVCVLVLFAAVMASHLIRFDTWTARQAGWDFAKLVAYYLILVSVVNTPRRLTRLLTFIVLAVLVVNSLSVLQYHGRIDIPALSTLMENDYDELTGEVHQTPRMRSTGIFNDPNDLSMIIVVSMLLCLAAILYKRLGVARFALLAPAGFLFYCLLLTQSRGGLLAFIAGCGVLTYCKLGKFRTAMLGAAGVPVLLTGIGGRQTNLSAAMSGGTGQARVELWSAGLQMFKSYPLFGYGQDRYAEFAGQVAHNSFVHAFGELGLFGGTAFLGFVGLSAYSLWSLRSVADEIKHPALSHLRPYLFAVVIAASISMLSLSRNYVVPTYLIMGLGAVHFQLTQPRTSLEPIRVDGRLLGWLFVASVGFIVLNYLYIKVFFRLF